jgi:hypothetical protein
VGDEKYSNWTKSTQSFIYRDKNIYVDEIIPFNFRDFDVLNFFPSLKTSRKWIDYEKKILFYIKV